MISTVCDFYDFLSVKNDTNVSLKSKKWSILKVNDEGTFSQMYGSEDPDPYQSVTDPENCNIQYQHL